MIKALGNPERKRWIGDTKGLIQLKTMGMVLRYEVMTDAPEYAVRHAPRSPRDPMPFVQVGGLESRLRSTEIVAIEADAFAAWEAEQDAAADAWIESIDRSLSTSAQTEIPAAPRYELVKVGSFFEVRDHQRKVAVFHSASRYAANDKLRRLGVEGSTEIAASRPWPMDRPRCIHGKACSTLLGSTSIPVCTERAQYGVWDETDAGFTHVVDCAQDAADWAAEQLDNDPDGEMSVKVVCSEHNDYPHSSCEECDAEGCGAVDAEDWDACGHCADCSS